MKCEKGGRRKEKERKERKMYFLFIYFPHPSESAYYSHCAVHVEGIYADVAKAESAIREKRKKRINFFDF